MPEAGKVTIEVYDLIGQRVYEFELEHASEGQYQLELPLGGAGLPSGLYLTRITRNTQVDDLRIILNR